MSVSRGDQVKGATAENPERSDAQVDQPRRFQMSEADLVDMQQSYVETAKQQLLENGSLRPVVIILAPVAVCSRSVEEGALQDVPEGPPTSPDSDYAQVFLFIDYGVNELYRIILNVLATPDHRRKLEAAMELGRRSVGDWDEQRGREVVVRTYLEQNEMIEPDIVAANIRHTLRKLNASAYFKIDDGYLVVSEETTTERIRAARKKLAPSLADEPTSKECVICALEHAGGYRQVTLTYEREEPKKGRVVRFDEPMVLDVKRGPEGPQGVSGRFAWMLDIPNAAPKEGVQ